MSNTHGLPSESRWGQFGRVADADGWRPPELAGLPEQISKRALAGSTSNEEGWVDHPLNHIRPYAYPFRTCWYCGSIHPDDLLKAVTDQGWAPHYDLNSKPEPRGSESQDHAYRRWVEEQHDLRGGIRLDESDWKYGWPHKFYVDGIPNPLAGQIVCSGGRYGSMDPAEHALGPAPATTHAKFYTSHLVDASDFAALGARLTEYIPNIVWERDGDGKLTWRGHRAPGVR